MSVIWWKATRSAWKRELEVSDTVCAPTSSLIPALAHFLHVPFVDASKEDHGQDHRLHQAQQR